jgi:beta-N-acetylhexosaminidase
MRFSRRSFVASFVLAPTATWGQRPFEGEPLDEGLLRLAGGCMLAGSRAPQLHPTLMALFQRRMLAGTLLSGENFHNRAMLDAAVRAVHTATPEDTPPALVAADQEGGVVSHLTPVLPRMPSLTALGRIDDPALTERFGAAMAAQLRSVGVNFNLAPVLDVRTNPANMVVHMRTFGASPELAARHARPLVSAMLDGGVLACAKHFPGHGDTATDSHAGLPRVAHDLARLEAVELQPFRAVIDLVPAVMLAHVVYTGVDAAHPATLSRAIATGILRERLGFRGVAVSDDLEMAAIRRHWGVPTGAMRALEAGCDLLIIAHTPGYLLESMRQIARRCSEDRAFLARVEQANERVTALRERLRTMTPTGAEVSPYAVIREVARRAPGASRHTAVDPTLRRP